jgi:hypothetical protein
MDFTQASVRGQFYRPDQVIGRVRPQVEQARQIWFTLTASPGGADLQQVRIYLQAVGLVANAIAGLSGKPLTERRFLIEFPQRAAALGHTGLYAGLLGLLGGPMVDSSAMRAWLPEWRQALEALPDNPQHSRLSRPRIPYYLRALDVMMDSDRSIEALWPLLNTWTDAVSLLPGEAPSQAAWVEAMSRLGLWGDSFSAKEAALDAYIDQVEELLEDWSRANGA